MGRHSTKLASPPPITSDSQPAKKRKREQIVDTAELEVNVLALEPPSKRALRKARKDSTSVKAKRDNEDDTERRGDSKTEDQESSHEKRTGKLEATSNRSEHGVWIGNLPWNTTKEALKSFFTENSQVKVTSITRIHMPAPNKASVSTSRHQAKARNKGFAYVDFLDRGTLDEALTLSNEFLAERRVLIKNAKSFEGRPDPSSESVAREQRQSGHPSNTRIFVGNLGFDMTQDDLKKHFEQCGEITHLQIATFEDSGKCKGYGWIEFGQLDAAEAAVRGWITVQENLNADADESHDPERAGTHSKKPKPRKWWVNQLFGRPLRTEFAESKTLRYRKRFSNEVEDSKQDVPPRSRPDQGGDEDRIVEHDRKDHHQENQKRQPLRKIDARNIKPGAALATAPRLTAAVVESQGTKTVLG